MNSRKAGNVFATVAVIVVLVLGGGAIFSTRVGNAGTSISSPRSTTAPGADLAAPTAAVDYGGYASGPVASSGTLSSFQTYSDLRQFVTTNVKATEQAQEQVVMGGVVSTVMGATSFATTTISGATTMMTTTAVSTVSGLVSAITSTVTGTVVSSAVGGSGTSPSYTTSNDQVQGVDELDIEKTDGTYIYVAGQQTVSVVKAYPVNESGLVSTISMPDNSVVGMTLGQGTLAVLGQSLVNGSVDLRLYDVAVPSAPVLMNSIGIAGNYVGARMAGGYFYLVLQQPCYQSNGQGNFTVAYPTVREQGVSQVISPDQTYYSPNQSEVTLYTMVVTMSMSTGAEGAIALLTGPSSTIYVSPSNIYVVYSNFHVSYSDGIAGNIYAGGNAIQEGASQNSTIFRVAYAGANVTAEATGTVPGNILSQYSMNEYEGYFQVATDRAGVDDVYVLNSTLGQVGALHDIAPGENIFAVRFEGDLGYVVTYEQVDPLFTISFANPADPTILAALHVTGFSDYLYPLGSDYLIGVGQSTVNSTQGDFSYYDGLKISLFNVTTSNSTEVDNYLIGNRGTTSAVLENPLAFTFDTATNTMVIPVDLYTVPAGETTSAYPGGAPAEGQFTWQGAYVFSVSDTGFTLLGTVTQDLPGQSPATHEVDRTVIIGNILYTISEDEVMATDLSNFYNLATIPLVG